MTRKELSIALLARAIQALLSTRPSAAWELISEAQELLDVPADRLAEPVREEDR